MRVVDSWKRPVAVAQLMRKTAPVSFHGFACFIRSNVRVLSEHTKSPEDRIQHFTQRPRLVTVPHKNIFSALRLQTDSDHYSSLPE
jgi:hypothetical protein